MQFPDSEFWNFSIRFYNHPEVEKTCLRLQNDFQLDVNCVLFIYWLASEHKTILSSEQWSQIISVSLPWKEIIKPLRKSRQLIKDSMFAWPGDFQQETRNSISEIEINAEHMQQLAMEKQFDTIDNSTSDAELALQITTNFSTMFSTINNDTTADMINKEIATLVSLLPDDQENKKIIA